MKKKNRILPVVLAILLVAGILGLLWYNDTYLTIGGTPYRRDLTSLDLSGQQIWEPDKLAELKQLQTLNMENTGLTGEDYDLLRRALPNCTISWTPIFQGKPYPEDTARLEIAALSAGDVEALARFPKLQTVDATACQDYDNLLALTRRMPGCELFYSVTIGGEAYDQDTTFVQVSDADMAQLTTMLPYLPRVNELLLTGILPEMAEIRALAAIFPQTAIRWQGTYSGIALDSEATMLDLTDIPMESAEAVATLMAYLPQLETLDIRGCGLSAEEAEGLFAQFPAVTCYFRQELTIGEITVPTDAEEIDISGTAITAEEMEALLPYFTNLKKVVMCDCGIDNETMDALNRRHEDILFVWSVNLGPYVTVRTDISGFIPYKFHRDFSQEDLYNLRYCTELIALDVGHQNLTSCEFVQFMPKLKYLILADTDIQDLTPLTGLEDLVFLEIFMTYLTDYTPLLTLTNLKDLNLTATYGDHAIIAQMPWLERCWWGAMKHTKEQMAFLQEACPDTQFVFNNYDSTGNGWRQGKYYREMRDALDMFYIE